MYEKEILLTKLKELFENYSSFSEPLQNSLGLEKFGLDAEIRKFYEFKWTDEELVSSLFGGREVVKIDEIIEGRHHNAAFEGGAQDLIPCQHSIESVTMEDDRDSHFEDNVEISSLANIYPFFEYEGSYIFHLKSSDKRMNGLIGEVDTIGSYFAPSIEHHLKDLHRGLESGKYPIIDDELIYPSAWHNREKLHAGLVLMDEYGDIQ